MSATPEQDLSHHDKSPDARRASLRDLKTGVVHTKESSYVGEQNEVKGMLEAMKDVRWPGLIYEYGQGVLDHNDWTKGLPQIRLFMNPLDGDGEEQEVSYEEFLKIRSSIDLPPLTRIVFVNHIHNKQGLRPTDLTLTNHNEKDQPGTLGIHGRGSKIATTAALAGKHATKVSFSSYADGIGAWYGEAILEKDAVDLAAPEALKLRYKRDETVDQDTTEIAIHNPSLMLMECLHEFPAWFLPANPAYEHYRFGDTSSRVPNILTAYVNQATSSPAAPHEVAVANTGHARDLGRESARVEFLPQAVVPDPLNMDSYVYIDGLRVNAVGKSFRHPLAFWGFGSADYGWNAKRSNDSLSMEGDARSLLGEVFTVCNNPDVFERQLTPNNKYYWGGYEDHIPSSVLDETRMTPAAAHALRTAWGRITKGKDMYVTSNSNTAFRAEREDMPTLNVHSTTWALLLRDVANAQVADDIFEKQAAELRAQIEAEKEKTRRAEEEGVQRYLKERGITDDLASTGEVLKIPQPENIARTLELGKLHLLFALAQNNGKVIESAEGIQIDMTADGFLTLPTAVSQLGVISEFSTSIVSASAGDTKMEISIILNNTGRIFRLQGSSTPDRLGNMTLSVQSASLSLPFRSLLTLTCQLSSSAELQQFRRTLLADIAGLTDERGHVSKDKYLNSEFRKAYPPAAELLRIRDLLDRDRGELELALAQRNKLRKKAGLPPITDPSKHLADSALPQGSVDDNWDITSYDDTIEDDSPLHLLRPDGSVSLSTRGSEGRPSHEKIKRPPHMYLTPIAGSADGYLLTHVEPEFSDRDLTDYSPLSKISHKQMPSAPTLFFTQKLDKGLSALPVPPGYRPVSVHLGGEEIDVHISESDTGFFSIYSLMPIPAGLTVHFEPQKGKDQSPPTDKEKQVTARFESLNPHWKDLVRALKTGTLTDKQKVDILIRGWTKAFTYDKSQATYNKYTSVRSDQLELNSAIINYAIGNCGYADRGFYSLVSFLDIPFRPVVSYLSDGEGQFRRDGNLHGITQVYLEGKWINVEPQSGYIDDDVLVDPIPQDAKAKFQSLLSAIPPARRKVPVQAQGQETTQISVGRLPAHIEALLEEVKAQRPTQYIKDADLAEEPQLIENSRKISRPTEAAILLAMAGAFLGGGVAVETMSDDVLKKIHDVSQNTELQPLIDLLPSHSSFLIIPLLILFGASSYGTGKYIEKINQKKG